MKKILYIGALLITTTYAFTQSKCDDHKDHEKKEEKLKEMRDKMAKELSLTDEQIKKINLIEDKYKIQEDQLRNKSEELRKQIHKLKENKKSEIDKVFTEEQRQKIKKIKEDMHAKKNIYKKGLKHHD